MKQGARRGLAVALVAVFLSMRYCFAEEGPEKVYPSFKTGNIPKDAIMKMDEHTNALYYWMDAYLKHKIPGGLTLVHVDAHADARCGCINTTEKANGMLRDFKIMPSFLRKRQFEKLIGNEDNGLGEETFIIPAMRMGIIDTYIWVRPNPQFFAQGAPWRRQPFFYYLLASSQLKECDFCNREGDCQYEVGCEVAYFEIEKIPVIKGPVLLDIDMDAFGDQSMKRFCNLSFSPAQIDNLVDTLIELLAASAPEVYMVTVADSSRRYSTGAALSKRSYLESRLTGK